MENKSIYHYTSSLGLLGIIKDQAIRCTNLKFLNDRTEYNYLYSEFEKRHNADLEATLKKFNNETPKVKKLIKDEYNKFRNLIKSNVKDSYVACFTTNKDSIQNWMAYGRNSVNYSIEFKGTEILDATKVCGSTENEEIPGSKLLKYFVPQFHEVKYGVDHYPNNIFSQLLESTLTEKKLVTQYNNDELIENNLPILYNYMLFSFSLTKKEEWKHENEYRIVLSENTIFDGKKIVRRQGASDFISWRDSNGLLIPFANFPISRNLIKSVTYLAQHNPQRVKESLELLKNIYSLNFEIKESECSLVI